MRSFAIHAVVLLTAASSISMYADPSESLLSQEDYRVEQEGTATPAVSSLAVDGVARWKSFNHWQCLSPEQLRIECDPDPNEERQDICYPHLTVEQGSDVFEFEIMTPDDSINSKMVLDRWNTLLTDEPVFCAYASYLPDVSKPHESVYSLDRIKSAKGYWDYDAEENWQETEEEAIDR